MTISNYLGPAATIPRQSPRLRLLTVRMLTRSGKFRNIGEPDRERRWGTIGRSQPASFLSLSLGVRRGFARARDDDEGATTCIQSGCGDVVHQAIDRESRQIGSFTARGLGRER